MPSIYKKCHPGCWQQQDLRSDSKSRHTGNLVSVFFMNLYCSISITGATVWTKGTSSGWSVTASELTSILKLQCVCMTVFLNVCVCVCVCLWWLWKVGPQTVNLRHWLWRSTRSSSRIWGGCRGRTWHRDTERGHRLLWPTPHCHSLTTGTNPKDLLLREVCRDYPSS